jgi:hypothetical protein
VTIDGKAPCADHGADTDADGYGTVTEDRLYQLIRQHGAIQNRTFRIEFLVPGVQAYSFTYLKAYYDGKFYDRLSVAVSKPQLPNSSNLVSSLSNFSVPDSEIVAAETVLLEFLMDTIDPTPVMGDTKCPIPGTSATASCTPDPNDPKTTTYYPGKSSDQPTALTVGYAKYVQLPATGCGITTKNVWILQTLASGASDEAATVGGLVANTPGGLSIGLGIVGKISIGDNATPSDLVKTAASEVALRTTLLSSYFSLYRVNFTPVSLP